MGRIRAGEGVWRPGVDVDAVGDGVDPVAGKHALGRFVVTAGDTVYVAGQVEGEPGHVEPVAARKAFERVELDEIRQELHEEVISKAVVPRLDRRVRG